MASVWANALLEKSKRRQLRKVLSRRSQNHSVRPIGWQTRSGSGKRAYSTMSGDFH